MKRKGNNMNKQSQLELENYDLKVRIARMKETILLLEKDKEITQLNARIEELQEIICPLKDHNYKVVEASHSRNTTTIICTKCKLKKEMSYDEWTDICDFEENENESK